MGEMAVGVGEMVVGVGEMVDTHQSPSDGGWWVEEWWRRWKSSFN